MGVEYHNAVSMQLARNEGTAAVPLEEVRNATFLLSRVGVMADAQQTPPTATDGNGSMQLTHALHIVCVPGIQALHWSGCPLAGTIPSCYAHQLQLRSPPSPVTHPGQ